MGCSFLFLKLSHNVLCICNIKCSCCDELTVLSGDECYFFSELEIGGGSFEKIYLTRGPRGRERRRES